MNNLAIITARSGSKGLKNKNIRLLGDKPLLAYSIEAANKSKMFNEIVVSTDSPKYARIANEWGASTPFLRSSQTANDTASSWMVIKEVLKKYYDLGKKFDTITLLQPTSPFRISDDIINGYELLEEKEADAIVGVCEMEHSPLWSNILPENLSMSGFIDESVRNTPRQKLPVYYRINGALYILRVDSQNNFSDLYTDKCFAYIMPQERSIDIDTLLDFEIAEILLKPRLLN